MRDGASLPLATASLLALPPARLSLFFPQCAFFLHCPLQRSDSAIITAILWVSCYCDAHKMYGHIYVVYLFLLRFLRFIFIIFNLYLWVNLRLNQDATVELFLVLLPPGGRVAPRCSQRLIRWLDWSTSSFCMRRLNGEQRRQPVSLISPVLTGLYHQKYIKLHAVVPQVYISLLGSVLARWSIVLSCFVANINVGCCSRCHRCTPKMAMPLKKG